MCNKSNSIDMKKGIIERAKAATTSKEIASISRELRGYDMASEKTKRRVARILKQKEGEI